MSPTWLTVDHASNRLRSNWQNAASAASSDVTPVTRTSVRRAVGSSASSGSNWASTTVPAATIVAAWMSAEAGVGPSIASGSQSLNGSCADLPSTPQTRPSRTASRRGPSMCVHVLRMSLIRVVCATIASAARPTMNGASARRVTTKALNAARRAAARSLS